MRAPQRVVEAEARPQADEEHDPLVVRRVPPVLADDDALEHFVEQFHLAVDLGRADPNAAGIQRRVAAAVV